MKTNRDMILSYLRKAEKNNGEDYIGSTTQEIAEALGIKRCNISTQLNRLVEDGLLAKNGTRPIFYRLRTTDTMEEQMAFRGLVGRDGSLKNAVKLAKAAVLYPDAPLHILLTGPSGIGKTNFATQIFEFSKEMKQSSQDTTLKEINCQYYAENESALQREIENSANQDIFINHLQLLPMHTQAVFFRCLEKTNRKSGQMLICALDCESYTSLSDTITDWFPVHIMIPTLEERGLKERFELVSSFFMEESGKMRRAIKLNSELLYCLMLYHCTGEIRQLRNDIRIGCANAYVREFHSTTPELHVYVSDFPMPVRNGFLNWKQHRQEMEKIIPRDFSYVFSDTSMSRQAEMIGNAGESNIYALIETKENELRTQGINEEEISRIISGDLEQDLKKLQESLGENQLDKESLAKIVDVRVISMVEDFLEKASNLLGRAYPSSTFYGLCLHLSAFLEKTGRTQSLSQEKVLEVIETYKEEYTLSLKFAMEIEQEFQVTLPADEIVLVTMFICREDIHNASVDKPVVLIAMHGTSAATSICNVVNALVSNRNTYAFDFPLDMNMENAYRLFVETIQRIHRGKGILLLHDVGSIKTIAGLAMQNTGIPIRCIEIPFTLIALECSQKASLGNELESVYYDVMQSCQNALPLMRESYQRLDQERVIVTLCMSGQGGAIQIKKYIEKNMDLNGIQVIPLAVSDPEILIGKINTILEKHEIICLVGTYNPEIYNIPFISIAKLFETPLEKLPLLLATAGENQSVKIDYDAIYEYLSEGLPDLNISKLRRHLPRAVARIKKSAGGLNEAQELGLFMHLACSVSRLKSGEDIGVNRKKNQIIGGNKKLYYDLTEILKPLENAFEIHYSDDEIASLIEISKRV